MTQRIYIIGVPGAGKTTLAKTMANEMIAAGDAVVSIISSDDIPGLRSHPWDEIPEHLLTVIQDADQKMFHSNAKNKCLIIEGCQVVRLLSRRAAPLDDGDRVIFMGERADKQPILGKQASMAAMIHKKWKLAKPLIPSGIIVNEIGVP